MEIHEDNTLVVSLPNRDLLIELYVLGSKQWNINSTFWQPKVYLGNDQCIIRSCKSLGHENRNLDFYAIIQFGLNYPGGRPDVSAKVQKCKEKSPLKRLRLSSGVNMGKVFPPVATNKRNHGQKCYKEVNSDDEFE